MDMADWYGLDSDGPYGRDLSDAHDAAYLTQYHATLYDGEHGYRSRMSKVDRYTKVLVG
jgi:hypothetical protein